MGGALHCNNSFLLLFFKKDASFFRYTYLHSEESLRHYLEETA